jgi:hypothetical protein
MLAEVLPLHDTPSEGLVLDARECIDSCLTLMRSSNAWFAQADLYPGNVESREKCLLRADRHMRLAWYAHEKALVLLSRDLRMPPPGVGGRASAGMASPQAQPRSSARPPTRGAGR